jgi:hypothetical protein
MAQKKRLKILNNVFLINHSRNLFFILITLWYSNMRKCYKTWCIFRYAMRHWLEKHGVVWNSSPAIIFVKHTAQTACLQWATNILVIFVNYFDLFSLMLASVSAYVRQYSKLHLVTDYLDVFPGNPVSTHIRLKVHFWLFSISNMTRLDAKILNSDQKVSLELFN